MFKEKTNAPPSSTQYTRDDNAGGIIGDTELYSFIAQTDTLGTYLLNQNIFEIFTVKQYFLNRFTFDVTVKNATG